MLISYRSFFAFLSECYVLRCLIAFVCSLALNGSTGFSDDFYWPKTEKSYDFMTTASPNPVWVDASGNLLNDRPYGIASAVSTDKVFLQQWSGTNNVSGSILLNGAGTMLGVNVTAKAGSVTSVGGEIQVKGASSMTIESGASLSVAGGFLIDISTVTVNGSLTQTGTSSSFLLGSGGANGKLVVKNGTAALSKLDISNSSAEFTDSSVTLSGLTRIGAQYGSSSVSMTGGTLSTVGGAFVVGETKKGTFTQNSGTVNLTKASNFRIGSNAGAGGSVYYLKDGVLNFGYSGYNTGSGTVYIGTAAATGSLIQSGGSFNSLANVNIDSGSKYQISGETSKADITGSVKVSNNGSYVHDDGTTDISVNVEVTGNGNYTHSGGTTTVSQQLLFGAGNTAGQTSTFTLSGGTLNVESSDVAFGLFSCNGAVKAVQSGTSVFNFTGKSFLLGNNGSSIIYNLESGTLNIAPQSSGTQGFYVGRGATSELNQTGGTIYLSQQSTETAQAFTLGSGSAYSMTGANALLEGKVSTLKITADRIKADGTTSVAAGSHLTQTEGKILLKTGSVSILGASAADRSSLTISGLSKIYSTGNVTQTNADVSLTNLNMGIGYTSLNSAPLGLTVSGTNKTYTLNGGKLDISENMKIGDTGDTIAQFNQTLGQVTVGGDFSVLANAKYELNGAASTLNVGKNMTVAAFSNFDMSDGSVTVDGDFYLTIGGGKASTFNISGGKLTVNGSQFILNKTSGGASAVNHSAQFTQSGTSQVDVNTETFVIGQQALANNQTSYKLEDGTLNYLGSGSVLVSNPKSLFSQAGGTFNVGEDGSRKDLLITNGAEYKMSGGTLYAKTVDFSDSGKFTIENGTVSAKKIVGNLSQSGGKLSGVKEISGDYSLGTSGVLELNLNSHDDILNVSGQAQLDGTLRLLFGDDFLLLAETTPQSFVVDEDQNITGAFTSVLLNSAGDPLSGWLVVNNGNSLDLTSRASVPEPASVLLLIMGTAILFGCKLRSVRRKRIAA